MTSYSEATLRWREQQDAALRAERGWLSLAGLLWLAEGDNRAGADPECDIALPAGAPALLGVFTRNGDVVTFRPAAEASINGEPAVERELRPDMPGPADVLTFGGFSLIVIKRGARVGLRLWDHNHPALSKFAGRRWYAVDERWRITARFEAYDPPRPILIPNILGDVEERLCPGVAVFMLDEQECRLEPTMNKDGSLFFVMRDGTSGHETYGVARFLQADAPQNGMVMLDFNRAHNPPCAFTEFATCPLPPRQNILTARIEAGELDSGMFGHE